jgi:hypothetical protein
MLTIVCVILYGGGLYYISIAMGIPLGRHLDKVGLGFVGRTWKRGPEGRITVVAGTIIVLLILEGAIIGPGGGASGPSGPGGPGEPIWTPGNLAEAGYTAEGSTSEPVPDFEGRELVGANISLFWWDDDVTEPPGGPFDITPKNQPDTFRLTVNLPDGTQVTKEGTSTLNDPSRPGVIELNPIVAAEGQNLTDMTFEVECVQAGDVTGRIITYRQDNGNDWILDVDYVYLEYPAED